MDIASGRCVKINTYAEMGLQSRALTLLEDMPRSEEARRDIFG